MKLSNHIDALIVLDAISRRGSFAAAAEELHRATSSVTYSIQKLEESLDITIFDRSGHKAKLTPAGSELLTEGRALLNHIQLIEHNVKLVAGGWETVLRLAINDIIPSSAIQTMLKQFYKSCNAPTQIRITRETFQGPWDAIVSGRTDIAIGVGSETSFQSGYSYCAIGHLEFVFVVAPTHPLANHVKPIHVNDLQNYRAVAAADSSRVLPARSFGLLDTQPVLAMPDQTMKYDAIKHGLGVGHLPMHMIRDDLANGQLVQKDLENNPELIQPMFAVWPSSHKGKALAWFSTYLSETHNTSSWFS